MSRLLYLIAYDISCPRVQHQILNLIKSYAIGGQKSLYECWMTKNEMNLFRQEAELLVDNTTDSVLIFQLNQNITPLLVGQHKRIAFDPFIIV